MADLRFARTETLEIAYEESGDPAGSPIVLLHGFPYDARSYDGVVTALADTGARVIVPYLRGYGPTRFMSGDIRRSGQQAAIGADLLDLLDVLGIRAVTLAGYDWGGRAACIVAALWPERVTGLVTVDGYNIQDIASSAEPESPAAEKTSWYQYYFHSERGRTGLERNRDELCELLWRDWSPTWQVGHDDFLRSAPSLHNPDFVDIVIHSYRHRFGLEAGDPRYDDIEARLARHPPITVPTIAIEAGSDGFLGSALLNDRARFTGPFEYRLFADTGHNVPQQSPAEFADAVRTLL